MTPEIALTLAGFVTGAVCGALAVHAFYVHRDSAEERYRAERRQELLDLVRGPKP